MHPRLAYVHAIDCCLSAVSIDWNKAKELDVGAKQPMSVQYTTEHT